MSKLSFDFKEIKTHIITTLLYLLLALLALLTLPLRASTDFISGTEVRASFDSVLSDQTLDEISDRLDGRSKSIMDLQRTQSNQKLVEVRELVGENSYQISYVAREMNFVDKIADRFDAKTIRVTHIARTANDPKTVSIHLDGNDVFFRDKFTTEILSRYGAEKDSIVFRTIAPSLTAVEYLRFGITILAIVVAVAVYLFFRFSRSAALTFAIFSILNALNSTTYHFIFRFRLGDMVFPMMFLSVIITFLIIVVYFGGVLEAAKRSGDNTNARSLIEEGFKSNEKVVRRVVLVIYLMALTGLFSGAGYDFSLPLLSVGMFSALSTQRASGSMAVCFSKFDRLQKKYSF